MTQLSSEVRPSPTKEWANINEIQQAYLGDIFRGAARAVEKANQTTDHCVTKLMRVGNMNKSYLLQTNLDEANQVWLDLVGM